MYRSFECGAWGDPWFELLSPTQKLIFINLFTNMRTTSCGSVGITTKAIAFETGVPQDEVTAILHEWNKELKPRVVWFPDHHLVWVRTFFRHQNCNPNFEKSAMRAALACPLELREIIYSVYPQLHPEPPPIEVGNESGSGENSSKPSRNRSKTLSSKTVPAGNGLGTVSYKNRTEQNQDSTESEQNKAGQDKPLPEGSADPGCVDVVVSLIQLGVSAPVAQRLAAAHPAEKIRQQIEWLPLRKPRDAPSMIVRAIERDMQQPGGTKQRRDRQESDRRIKATVDALQDNADHDREYRSECHIAFNALSLDEQAEILRAAKARIPESVQALGKASGRAQTRLLSAAIIEMRNAILGERGLVPQSDKPPIA